MIWKLLSLVTCKMAKLINCAGDDCPRWLL